ncbi:G-patch domain [Nesidiocoris tenuis]|uniref:G-patch domain n=1 Tax=Nesidiocoris tenuis TaxID=355587 RepID=A0ABN7B993_9HEMI|nr:G-patch domain [Nesidiocoris tenuis]
MEKDKKSSDEILKELFSSINDITEKPPSVDSDSDSSSSSSENERKVTVKKEKKSKRYDSSSKHKHKKRKKSKKSTKYSVSISDKRRSSHEKKSSRKYESAKEKDDKVKIKSEKELPLLEVLKKEMIHSAPSSVMPEQPLPSLELPVVVKQEKFDEPKKEDIKIEGPSDASVKQDEKQNDDTSEKILGKVADVFVEDMLDSGVQPVAQTADATKKTIQIQDLKNCNILAVAENLKAKKEEMKANKKRKREDGELSEGTSDESESSDSDDEETEPSQSSSKKKKSHKKDEERHKSKKKKSKHGHKDRKSDDKSIRRSESSKHSDRSDRKRRSDDRKNRRRSRSSSRSSRFYQDSRSYRERTRGLSRSRSRDRPSWRPRSRSGGRRKDSDKDSVRDLRKKLDGRRSSSRSDRDRKSREEKDEYFIDKRKLLEIARRNALSMMKQGQVGTDIDKVACITAGGKTVDQLTDFCKHLSQKEATGLESVSSESSSEDDDQPFHHPFQIKERPNIVLNIRNCGPLPSKSLQEKSSETLMLQFPVSSGSHHRKNESEWVPVSPKKTETKTATTNSKPKAVTSTAVVPLVPYEIPQPQPTAPPVPTYSTTYPAPVRHAPTDIGTAITERLNAIRQEQDASAMFNVGSGLFTGSTGAKLLSPLQLASGQQAWARKDQLISATPVSGGMGMSLLQKMGWKPGEGLGKNHEGTLEPLKLPVKMDKRGLVCAEEMTFRQRQAINRMPPNAAGPRVPPGPVHKSLEGKHPVSLLVEFCTRRRYDPPIFNTVCEEGPPHQKRFILKVTVNNVDYQPAVSSSTKKIAKSEAAKVCLKALGVLPNS